jgi:hypothetical protein
VDGEVVMLDGQAGEVILGPRLVIRAGRGRTGGSTGLDVMVQRARHQGRRVKPLDGDLRSRTLSALYPAEDEKGRPIRDGASAPPTDELPDIKAWLSSELDEMIREGVSRVLDLSGGDRVMQEYIRDLDIMAFCKDFGIEPTVAVYLGPDMEDFRHALQLLAEVPCDRVLLMLNEGIIRNGQTTAGAFDAIRADPAFGRLLERGARPILVRRLTCMAVLRERGLRFYDVVRWKPGTAGSAITPTLYHMTKVWLQDLERGLEDSNANEWLP